MGGCASSVEDKKGQDKDHTDGTEHKEEAKATDVTSPRQIDVQQAEPSEDAAADEYQKPKTKTQGNVSVGLANTLIVTQDARLQSNTIGTMEDRDELVTSPSDIHENGAQERFSQSHRMEDRNKRVDMFTMNKDLTNEKDHFLNSRKQRGKEIDEFKTRSHVSYRNEEAGPVDLKLQIQELRNERNDMFNINKDLTEERDHLLNSLKQKDKEIDGLKTRSQASYRNEDAGTSNLKLQIHELRNERSEMIKFNQDLMTKNTQLSNALVQKEEEVDDIRTRLSRVASERLTDNNPNVADLSDRNRPTKIADRYTEVYSNEWSDAYEDLVATGERNEIETIQILLDFIENIYKTCLHISVQHANNLSTHILLFTGQTQISTSLSSALKPFKDTRKLKFKEFLPTLQKETNNLRDLKLVKKSDRTKKVQKYLDIATELCWLMCIQDPPLHLHTDCKHGHKFDEDHFSAYTVRGTKVDYLVWPALLLHKDGPVLKKGVAQAQAIKEQNRK